MIFEEVILHNFGVYQGRHAVPLEVSAARPVVLIGAMNGSGKTTFLDSMQLALYGKSARCTGRERVSYNEYLGSMINRDVAPAQGAGVEFAFRTRSNGQDSRIRVKRTWSIRGQSVKENLEVFRDGVLDEVASERWQEFVEDFMPSQIADLFFFDGEKIEALADPTRSASLLRVGVHSLLGIDLVESLIKSLQQVERKRKTTGAGLADRKSFDALQTQRIDLEEKQKTLLQQLGALRTSGDSLKQRIDMTKGEFKRLGGELFERHNQLQHEKSLLERRKSELENMLRVLASGVLPLSLLGKLLQNSIDRASNRHSAKELTLLQKVSTERDIALIKFLKKATKDKAVVTTIGDYLERERKSRFSPSVGNLTFPDGMVEQYRPEHIQASKSQAASLLSELTGTKERLSAVDANLSAVPDESTIAPIQRSLESLLLEETKNSLQVSILKDEAEECERKIGNITLQMDRESDRIRKELLGNETSDRVISHSAHARSSLSTFRDHLLRQNLDRLQISIGTCFRRLLRKQSLVSSVVICPETFQLSVINPGGVVVPAHRLSAGERQLLAVATLWALSQASGRHLPTVIDTPLSRLDSRHRGTIVRNYFPSASHQVILLSTDEEVVGRYYSALEQHIGRQYLIEHDEEKNTSLFRQGYFASAMDYEEKAA